MSNVVTMKLDGKARVLFIAFLLVFGIGCFFAVRWQIGNMLASATRFDDSNSGEVAATAIRFSPSDPSGYSLLATIENSPAAVIELAKQAVARSPNDHRLRVALAKAYESEEFFDEADAEFRKAIELAPAHASPRWYYGNFLLRRDREADAIANLKIAAEDNEDFRDQVYSLVWEYYGRDPSSLDKVIGERADSIARSTYFLAGRGYAEQALVNWNRLPADERHAYREVAKAIAHGLFGHRYFKQALEFAQNYGMDAGSKPEIVTDGSFEKPFGSVDETLFSWRISRNDGGVEIAQDSRVKRSGNRSLRVGFKGFTGVSIPNLSQYIVVVSGLKYRLAYWVRTENLRSPGLPFVEIVDGKSDRVLARSAVFAQGSSDWQLINTEFSADAASTGVYIRLGREMCGEGCVVNGLAWLDDIELTRR